MKKVDKIGFILQTAVWTVLFIVFIAGIFIGILIATSPFPELTPQAVQQLESMK